MIKQCRSLDRFHKPMRCYQIRRSVRNTIYMVLMARSYHQAVGQPGTISMMQMICLRHFSVLMGSTTHPTLRFSKLTCALRSDAVEWVRQVMVQLTTGYQSQQIPQIKHPISQAVGQMGHHTTNQNQTHLHISQPTPSMPTVGAVGHQVAPMGTQHQAQAAHIIHMAAAMLQMHLPEEVEQPQEQPQEHHHRISIKLPQPAPLILNYHQKGKQLRKFIKSLANSSKYYILFRDGTEETIMRTTIISHDGSKEIT